MSSDLASFYDRTRAAKKIIVVDLGFLGDTVHLTPALWAVKSAWPKAELHVLTTPVGVQVLQMIGCVDKAWSIELNPAKRSLRQQWGLLKELRRQKFEIAFNLNGSDRTIFMTALTGARWRVAYPGGRSHFYNKWLVPNWTSRQDPNTVVFEQRRQVLAACGVPLIPPRFDLRPDAQSQKWAEGIVSPQAIHISPNSAKATREWPLEHHAALLRELWRTYPNLQVLASSGAADREQQRLQQLSIFVNDSRLRLLPEELTIPQLAAVLGRSRLHIGPDSGVLHLAVALDVPTVSFFREQGAYKSFMPIGPRHQTISMPCHCVDHRTAPCEALGRAECFARIEPNRVANLVREQLGLF
jgi:heptosyltransferase-3